ncbi:SusC/RagA family TonB-linked outer membrane protein [Cytophaga hutchinsonii]|uniref:TonB-dependent outer membrane receptor n=1 Tax=Cytophaga hutchinsonii (strain ATCC 33406 / DSM 1761 / CIP 103989 / NBRC 15051 / NCIMB 9469 / D465) TaxID=269798 RepID=A0A6N4SNI2_CYTH3|nr:TonB-dependent receptor [Cytophaga hutchinsonii]ABG57840.1 tonB-dependent outer membrane receptor [Cytophaga hutchinsonii ATCC 33406]SFX07058.1 TonB-linked outer membrane protein, SusC/RagA family [Cytophaga hutchinsonii ATCC 33406]
MKKLDRLLNTHVCVALFFMVGFQWTAFSQTTLKGTVTDEAGVESIIGAIVQVKGTNTGTATDIDGNYALQIDTFPSTIVISSVGYITREIALATPTTQLNITMIVDQEEEEIVIVGYGEQTKHDLVGAVSKIDPAETKTIPAGSFDAQLQGKATGVQIATNSGVPGSDVFIRVRGATSINASNDPLYIIDGVFVNNQSLQNTTANGLAQDRATSPMADINPNDIESIEVLKDASAVAIYGSRGANGVVIVTTKRGTWGAEKVKINFNASEGLTWAPKGRIWKTATGPEQAMLLNEYNRNMGLAEPFRPKDQIVNGVAGRGLPQDQPTYDRLSYLYQTGHIRNYDLSFAGGSNTTRYYIGAGYNYQDAVWKPMDFQRQALKFNLDQKIGRRVTVGISNTFTRVYRDQARPANGGNGTLLQASLSIPAYLPIFDDNGTPLKWVNFDNIYTLTSKVNLWSTSYHYIGNLYADWEIIKNLKFHTSTSLDYNLYDEKQYWQKSTQLGVAGGLGSNSITQSTQVMNEQTLRYNTTFARRHNVGALVGNTLQSVVLTNVTANGQGFPNDSYTQISAASIQTGSQYKTNNTLASFFSRVDYNYNHKYYLELTGRADGSSRFGENNKWGFFPAVGTAWRINKENFMADVKPISNLKWRTSYGITGNQAGINDFASRGLWNAGYGYSDKPGVSEGPGTAPFQAANPDLKWERTAQFSTGIEIGLFKDRINIEANYYNKYTTNLLLNLPVPSSTGFTSYTANAGAVRNKGFELGIQTVNIENKNFTWTTELTVSRNKNKVEKLPNTVQGFDTRNLTSIQEGYSLYSYWVYNQTGVNSQTGAIEIEDVNKDGKITTADRKIMGSVFPKLFGGFNNKFTYKGIDLGIFFIYSYGNKTWNQNEALGEQGGTLGDNRVLMAGQLDRWTTPGQETMVPKLTAANYQYFEVSRFLEDASFIRLRSLTLGYTLPKKWSSAVKTEKIRFYFTGTNLLLITKYTGSDPESNLGQGNLQGYDYDTPPQPRTIQFGLNLTL